MPQRASAGRIQLKPTQERVLAALSENGATHLTRGEYEQIAGVSRSQAAYDLAELVEAGFLERVGGGRATRYRLRRREQPVQRRWTDERIRAELAEFCAGRHVWPSASEFKEAGHSDLYVAASRYGGIGFWASELGFPRPGRAAPPQPVPAPPPAPVRPWRPRLRWAASGAAFAGALFASAGVAFFAWHQSPARDTAARQTQESPARQHASHRRAGKASRHAAKTAATAHSVKREQAQKSTSRVVSHPQTQRERTSSYAQLAAETVASTPTHSAASTTQAHVESPPATSSGGPAPLPAPAGSGGTPPSPIPPPH